VTWLPSGNKRLLVYLRPNIRETKTCISCANSSWSWLPAQCILHRSFHSTV